MYKISIITVVYNNADKIEKTIKNVLSQTYQNLEYIIVDGASTDGTKDIIRKYEEKLIWISEPDNGIYEAMMKGVNLATGEWILFRNCGDFFFKPDSIADIFNNYDDKGEDFLIANARFFRSWGYMDQQPSILSQSYYDDMPVFHPSTFIRLKTQKKFPFRLEYKNSADYCFFVEVFKEGASYKYFNKILALVECEIGATADNYYRTISENIDFLTKFGAPQSRLLNLKKSQKSVAVKSKILKHIPFFQYYRKKRLIQNGWIEYDMSKELMIV